MSNMYSKEIIEHYKKPRNFWKLPNFTHSTHVSNSACGDELDLYLKIEGEKVTDVGFEGSGCAICIGAMSILSERIKGNSVEELKKLDDDFVLDLIGMDKDSPRIRCATLSVEAIQGTLK